LETSDDVEAEKEVVLASFACGEMDVDIESGRPSRSWATIKRVLWAREEHRAADKKKKHLEELQRAQEELKAQCEASALGGLSCRANLHCFSFFIFATSIRFRSQPKINGRTVLFIHIILTCLPHLSHRRF
jgi:hypothetical protein